MDINGVKRNGDPDNDKEQPHWIPLNTNGYLRDGVAVNLTVKPEMLVKNDNNEAIGVEFAEGQALFSAHPRSQDQPLPGTQQVLVNRFLFIQPLHPLWQYWDQRRQLGFKSADFSTSSGNFRLLTLQPLRIIHAHKNQRKTRSKTSIFFNLQTFRSIHATPRAHRLWSNTRLPWRLTQRPTPDSDPMQYVITASPT